MRRDGIVPFIGLVSAADAPESDDCLDTMRSRADGRMERKRASSARRTSQGHFGTTACLSSNDAEYSGRDDH